MIVVGEIEQFCEFHMDWVHFGYSTKMTFNNKVFISHWKWYGIAMYELYNCKVQDCRKWPLGNNTDPSCFVRVMKLPNMPTGCTLFDQISNHVLTSLWQIISLFMRKKYNSITREQNKS